MEIGKIFEKSLLELAQLIKDKEVTSVEVTQMMLDRISQLDEHYMSYLHVCSERALERAKEADRLIAKGIYKGPLHGVPIALKDLCYTTYAPSTAGTLVHAEFKAPYNATVVDRLEVAGAVILGKLTMTEGAYTSHHPDIPAPLNPWNEKYWVGSSSTGSGVATSAHLCFGSLGSDTGGSIRFPSATCGLTGIKPTWGRVSRHGIFALADSLDHIGPIARSAADAAALLQAIAGWDKYDPTCIDAPVPDFMAQVGKSIRDLRIGIDRKYALDGVDSQVAEALERAVNVFESLGARIVYVDFPDYEHLVSQWIMMCSVETAIAHKDTYPQRSEQYGPDLVQLIEQGLNTSGEEHAQGVLHRLAFKKQVGNMFNNIDCMLIPTLPIPTPSLEKMMEYGEDPNVLNSILRFTAPFDFSGNPTITLPNGIDRSGMPLSMQIVGPQLGEAKIIRAAHAYQTMTDWHRKTPGC